MLSARLSVRWVSWIASTAILCLFIKPYISNHFSCLKSLTVLTLPQMFSDATLMWSLEVQPLGAGGFQFRSLGFRPPACHWAGWAVAGGWPGGVSPPSASSWLGPSLNLWSPSRRDWLMVGPDPSPGTEGTKPLSIKLLCLMFSL